MSGQERKVPEAEVGFLRVFAFIWRYWRRFPVTLAGVGVGLTLTFGCEILLPVASGKLVDVVAHGPTPELITRAIWALLAFLGLMLVVETSRVTLFFLWIRLATRVMPRMVADAFHKVQRFTTDWHANNFAGATVRRITRGMWAYDQMADTLAIGLIPSIIMLVGLSIMLMVHWWSVGLAFAATVVIYVTTSVLLAVRWVGPANETFAQQDSDLGGMIADAVTCNSVVQSFAAEAREDTHLKDVAEIWRKKAVRAWGRGTALGGIQASLSIVMLVILLGLGLSLWRRGLATPGQMTLIVTTFFMVQGYLRQVSQNVRQAQRAVNDIADMIIYCDMPTGITDQPGAHQLKVTKGEIRFENVKFHYGNRPTPLFEDLNVTILPGEKVALVGKSGSGKSTFVRLIQRLFDVSDGRVAIDGQDVSAVTLESLRSAIALVPQEPILFHRSLSENIGYARPDATQAEIEAAAARAHADGFISELTEGYGTLVGERGVKLSGGERQRVAIARAFLADAPIVIMDEATSSLDSVTEALIQDSLHHLMEGRTTILIAHRLSTVRDVDRILVFSQGKIVEEGSHDALMKRPGGVYRGLYEMQHQGAASAA
jgi:ATP-binding cassette subfamily B protein